MLETQTRRPVIGIPCSIYPDSWFTPANGNAVSYLRALEAAGAIPLLIHLTRDGEVLDAHYARCDALLLAGGEDVSPSCYGAAPHPKLGKTNPEQDEVETRVEAELRQQRHARRLGIAGERAQAGCGVRRVQHVHAVAHGGLRHAVDVRRGDQADHDVHAVG